MTETDPENTPDPAVPYEPPAQVPDDREDSAGSDVADGQDPAGPRRRPRRPQGRRAFGDARPGGVTGAGSRRRPSPDRGTGPGRGGPATRTAQDSGSRDRGTAGVPDGPPGKFRTGRPGSSGRAAREVPDGSGSEDRADAAVLLVLEHLVAARGVLQRHRVGQQVTGVHLPAAMRSRSMGM
nr:hypothetical protein GCM10020093_043430 [Planobispora longispora]